jgi:hypothetical protein
MTQTMVIYNICMDTRMAINRNVVIPMQVGIQISFVFVAFCVVRFCNRIKLDWIPACAGMTRYKVTA